MRWRALDLRPFVSAFSGCLIIQAEDGFTELPVTGAWCVCKEICPRHLCIKLSVCCNSGCESREVRGKANYLLCGMRSSACARRDGMMSPTRLQKKTKIRYKLGTKWKSQIAKNGHVRYHWTHCSAQKTIRINFNHSRNNNQSEASRMAYQGSSGESLGIFWI